ncbi:MBL fold metallo-hydrolase [Clostridium sp. OS1-26]|uniref:ComEC/Rec2 family competence protein n=1 Tax=Clostridium sp. OS1-26 TaxID=3070681 RepID=UPI0027E01893|nr:MBL fold metallo-hydrolase [Clostridium sp. OS1-26]WML36907.1 MBL fold metallo-hydrolase [Clostridium sp. OS1-26]
MKKRIVIFILTIIVLISGTVYAKQDKYEVHFLDVGQSDCILIKAWNKNYIIDTGAAYYFNRILKYLESNSIDKVDMIILTHYHDDHYGGLLRLVQSKKVKNVLIPNHYNEVKVDLYKDLAQSGVKVKNIGQGWKLKKGKVELEAVAPLKEDDIIENNNSIVIKGEIDGIKYLFAADCEKNEEEDMLKKGVIEKCDILKVPHHSLDTSSTENFMNVVKPKVAIVTSDGIGTPDDKIIERIHNKGALVLRSDLHGNIVIKNDFIRCDKNGISIRINKN